MFSFKGIVGDIRHFFDAVTGVRHSRVTLHSEELVPSPEGMVPKYSVTTTVTGDEAKEIQRLGAAHVQLVPVSASLPLVLPDAPAADPVIPVSYGTQPDPETPAEPQEPTAPVVTEVATAAEGISIAAEAPVDDAIAAAHAAAQEGPGDPAAENAAAPAAGV